MAASWSGSVSCRYAPTCDARGETFELYADRSWRALVGHARFECILDPASLLDAGWYWVDIALRPQERGSLQPALYPDFGDGALEGQGIRLEGAWSERQGRAKGVILLPYAAKRLEFNPGGGYQPLAIGAFKLHRLSRPSAFLRLIFFPQGRFSLSRGVRRLLVTLKLTRRGLSRAASWLYRSFYEASDVQPAHVCNLAEIVSEQSPADHQHDVMNGPLFSILMPVFNTPISWLNACVDSVFAQSYDNWELCIADDASDDPSLQAALTSFEQRDDRVKVIRREVNGHISEATNSALSLATGLYSLLLDHDDVLHPEALNELATAVAEHPHWELIYTDEDKVDEHGERRDTYAKLDFGPDLLRSQNFVSHLGAYKTARLRELGGLRRGYEGSQDWDLALRFSELVGGKAVGHIPRVLYHWRISDQSTATDVMVKPYIRSAAKKALEDHLGRVGLNAIVRELAAAPGQFRLDYELQGDVPSVAIVLDIRGRPTCALDRCMTALWRSAKEGSGPDIIVMSGDDAEYSYPPIAKLRQIPVGAIAYGAACEVAAATTNCEVLLFLQPIIDGFRHGWLTELMALATREDVGAAGPRVYGSGGLRSDCLIELRAGENHEATQDDTRSMPATAGYLSLTRNVASLPLNGLTIRTGLFKELSPRLRECAQENFGAMLSSELLKIGKLLVHTPYAELHRGACAWISPDESRRERQDGDAPERFDVAQRGFSECVRKT